MKHFFPMLMMLCLCSSCSEDATSHDGGVPGLDSALKEAGLDLAALDTATGDTGTGDQSVNDLAAADQGTPDAAQQKKVDIIWVMPETNLTIDARSGIANASASIFSQLAAKNIDFRMGITNGQDDQDNPSKNYKVGKFCSVVSMLMSHDGGVDRFLLSTEQQVFKGCIMNPPGMPSAVPSGSYANAAVHNSQVAVTSHLPRQTSSQDKIRKGALVVVISLAYRVDWSVKNVVSSADETTCTLDSTTQTKVDSAVASYVSTMSGTSDPEAKVDQYHVIGSVCGSSCKMSSTYAPHQPHGHKEVAAKLGGKVHDCADIPGAITKIINGL